MVEPNAAERPRTQNTSFLRRSQDELEKIFQAFEEADSDEDSDVADAEEEGHSTAVVTSQLRHFVVQVFCDVPWELIVLTRVLFPGIPCQPSSVGSTRGASRR